ncbi:MAG: LptF/LptG family permease [Candidatus Omnitrophota bacterium]
MKIIDRYITGAVIRPFFYCLVIFIFLYCVIDILSNLDEITKSSTSLIIVLTYYQKIIPLILTQVMPMALLLATLYAMGTLNKHNEIIAIIAAGINIWRIISIFLGIGLLGSICMIYLNDKIVPYNYLAAIKIKEQYFKRNQPTQENKILSNASLYGMDNRIYFVRSYDVARAEMSDITILEHDHLNNITRKITASSGVWIDNKWTFNNVIETQYLNNQISLKPTNFQGKSYNFPEKPADFERSELQPNFMSYAEHRRYVRWLYRTGKSPRKERIDLYSRVALCFANLIAVFIALPFSLVSSQRQGVLLGMGISIFIAFSYWGVNAIAISFGKAGLILPAISAWFANIFFIILGTFLLKKSSL